MKRKVLCTDNFGGAGLATLKENQALQVTYVDTPSKQELLRIIEPYEALIVRSASNIDSDVIEKGKNLKIIGRAGIGTDNIAVDTATEKGIFVINAPLGNTTSTAELSFGMLLALCRHIPQAARSMAEGKWEKKRFKGSELAHKTLGVIGLGRVGREVAARAKAFKMQVIGYDPFLNEATFERIGVTPASLETIYKNADYITVHTPLSAETENMIGKEQFALMQPHVGIVNCARGGIVNEAELAEALKARTIGGAALDVYSEEPFLKDLFQDLENCINTPHLGASTAEAQSAVGLEIANGIIEFFEKGFATRAVNLPALDPEEANKLRPLLELAESLGKIIAQLGEGKFQTLKLSSTNRQPNILAIAAVRGLLRHVVNTPPTYVNALQRAKQRQIEVKEEFVRGKENGSAIIGLTLTSATGTTFLEGTVEDPDAKKLTRFNDYTMNIDLKDHLLLLENIDEPGTLGSLCNILGSHRINIAEMRNVRLNKDKRALTALRVDEAITDKALSEIRKDGRVLKSYRITT